MYWNMTPFQNFARYHTGLIETWDVLKYRLSLFVCFFQKRLIETWDVLKFGNRNHIQTSVLINRNMRCIEIRQTLDYIRILLWLIETWDVLKCGFPCFPVQNNTWLIETWDVLKYRRSASSHSPDMINRNMRCIEIHCAMQKFMTWMRLIETWDVLKCDPGNSQFRTRLRLIETWDVLKWNLSGDQGKE